VAQQYLEAPEVSGSEFRRARQHGGVGRYVAFTVDAARDLHHPCKTRAAVSSPNMPVTDIVGARTQGPPVRVRFGDALTLVWKRVSSRCLAVQERRTYRSDLRAYKYVTAP